MTVRVKVSGRALRRLRLTYRPTSEVPAPPGGGARSPSPCESSAFVSGGSKAAWIARIRAR